MTTLLLIRHAETDAVGKMIAGWQPGWPLNATGRMQAQELAQRLAGRPIPAIYASPLERAVQTALAIASPHHLPLQQVSELGEMRFGEWEGLTFQELDQRQEWHEFNRARSLHHPPGGEKMIEVQTRMVRQID